MKIRSKILLLMVFYGIGISGIGSLAFYSLRKSTQIQSSINLGNKLQRESGEIKSLMKDIVFDLFVPEMYGQIRSLTYSPRSAVTVSQWQEAVSAYKYTFDEFMDLSHFVQTRDDIIREQYLTALMMNAKAMEKLNKMNEALLIVKERYRSTVNIYNAMQKDEALIPFFTEFQETSYYFTNSFESFMNYFIKSLGEEGEKLIADTVRMFVIITSSFMLISMLFTFYLARDVSRKLNILENSLRQVSYGNFSIRININSRDEFGKFAETITVLIRELKENVDNILNLTRDAGSFISDRTDLRQLLDLVISAVLQDTSADSVMIYRLQKTGGAELQVSNGAQIDPEEQQILNDFLFSRIIRPNTYILQRNTTEGTGGYSFGQITAILAIPLTVDGRVFGLLVSLKTNQGKGFSDLGVTRLVTFAEYASLTIDNHFKYNELLERREARYQALHSQVQPHFLYNVLGGILGLNRKGDTEGIRKTVDALKEMLRYTQSQNKWTVIEDELEFIRRYFQLQKIRFGDRISFDISHTPEISHLRIPRLLLQPLAENAVIHGLEPLESGGNLIIRGEGFRRRGELGAVITIEDNGVGFHIEDLASGGNIGLTNVKQRLQIAFPDSSFKVESTPGKGTKIQITI